MPRIVRTESRIGIYHVMQRGVGKQIIFERDKDYIYYLKKLNEYKSENSVKVLAYCLMENHVHLLVQSENCELISALMQRLGTSYARYYNDRYFHVGHVFQGRYSCENVDTERYLYACVRYIHNNPVEAGIASRDVYRWSSYREYVLDNGISDREYVKSLIGDTRDFISFSDTVDDTRVMDCDNRILTSKDGIEYLKSQYGYDSGENSVVKSLRKNERDVILRDLKNKGYNAKQIERITGVSRAIVYKA